MLKAQDIYETVRKLKEESKRIHEELDSIYESFYAQNSDYEFEVTTEDNKTKWLRIYRPEGRFVYNQNYEMGLRSKPVKPSSR